jgi:hypothetical protein
VALKGDALHVIGARDDGWAKIDIDGNTFYIRYGQLTFTAPQ